ncbi:MAG TPA: hypothetical protein PK659_07580 [Methanothrix sp.]|nr:hypothetical protein [Methanothrix sp.]HOL44093.1 hypothetical protein [Methanothrix sp.]
MNKGRIAVDNSKKLEKTFRRVLLYLPERIPDEIVIGISDAGTEEDLVSAGIANSPEAARQYLELLVTKGQAMSARRVVIEGSSAQVRMVYARRGRDASAPVVYDGEILEHAAAVLTERMQGNAKQPSVSQEVRRMVLDALPKRIFLGYVRRGAPGTLEGIATSVGGVEPKEIARCLELLRNEGRVTSASRAIVDDDGVASVGIVYARAGQEPVRYSDDALNRIVNSINSCRRR